MMELHTNDTNSQIPFNILFNKYRLRGGFETLQQFGLRLAEEGFVYDDSVFSRWKNGSRIPRNRKVILAMIKIFVRYSAITTIEEANAIFYSLDLHGLHWDEVQQLS